MKKYEEFDFKSYLKEKIDEARNNIKNDVVREWKNIVGPELYGHIFFICIKNNILNISSEHPIYANAFKNNQMNIIKRLEELCPQYNIKGVKFNRN